MCRSSLSRPDIVAAFWGNRRGFVENVAVATLTKDFFRSFQGRLGKSDARRSLLHL